MNFRCFTSQRSKYILLILSDNVSGFVYTQMKRNADNIYILLIMLLFLMQFDPGFRLSFLRATHQQMRVGSLLLSLSSIELINHLNPSVILVLIVVETWISETL